MPIFEKEGGIKFGQLYHNYCFFIYNYIYKGKGTKALCQWNSQQQKRAFCGKGEG